MRWADHTAQMGKEWVQVLVENLNGKDHLEDLTMKVRIMLTLNI
jgi:hypothetical protein